MPHQRARARPSVRVGLLRARGPVATARPSQRCTSAPLRLAPRRSHCVAVLGCRQPLQPRCPPLPSTSPPCCALLAASGVQERRRWQSRASTRDHLGSMPQYCPLCSISVAPIHRHQPLPRRRARASPSRRPARRHPTVFPPGRPQPVDRHHGSRGWATEGRFGSCRGPPKAVQVLVRLAGGWSTDNMLFPDPVAPLLPPIGPAIWFPAPCSVLGGRREGEERE